MRLVQLTLLLVLCVAVGCKNEPIPRFSLIIENKSGDSTIRYTLTDTSFMIQQTFPLNGFASSTDFKTIMDNYRDTLVQISKMNIRSFNCNEQHALVATKITFTNDSGTFAVNPNINHPKELDAAVRIFNRYAPAILQLHFSDMQEAIEPDGQMRL